MAKLLFRSHFVRFHPETGLLNCLDVWKSANRPPRRRPSDWLEHPAVRAYMPQLLAKLYPDLPPSERQRQALRRTRGKGGVWSDPHLAIAYAQFLGNDLRDHLAEVLLRRGIVLNPDLVPSRQELFPIDLSNDSQQVLQQVAAWMGLALSANPGEAFRQLERCIYEPLLGNLETFRQQRGIKPGDCLRSALTPAERALVEATERLAVEDLLACDVSGEAILQVVRQRAERMAAMR